MPDCCDEEDDGCGARNFNCFIDGAPPVVVAIGNESSESIDAADESDRDEEDLQSKLPPVVLLLSSMGVLEEPGSRVVVSCSCFVSDSVLASLKLLLS